MMGQSACRASVIHSEQGLRRSKLATMCTEAPSSLTTQAHAVNQRETCLATRRPHDPCVLVQGKRVCASTNANTDQISKALVFI